ncbi:MAG: hypothetical protein PVI24_11250, partial [Myxococcales bacterium]
MSADAQTTFLTLVLRTELHGARIRDALEGAAVFLLPTIRVVGATAETGFVGAWATGAIHALLRVGTRRIEACQQAFSVDADLRIPALEV